jgi:hypothetical protein
MRAVKNVIAVNIGKSTYRILITAISEFAILTNMTANKNTLCRICNIKYKQLTLSPQDLHTSLSTLLEKS